MIYVSKKSAPSPRGQQPVIRRIKGGVNRRLGYVVARLTGGILVKRWSLSRLARKIRILRRFLPLCQP
jgi:hypothetical protein